MEAETSQITPSLALFCLESVIHLTYRVSAIVFSVKTPPAYRLFAKEQGKKMRVLPCLVLLLMLTSCSHPSSREEDSRAGILRPVSGTGSTQPKGSLVSGHRSTGHLYMGTGMGASPL